MAPEEAGDEHASGPPPHPLDRPWVHPSELIARKRPASPSARPVRAREIALAAGAGVIGALVMVVVLAIAGLLGGSSSSGNDAAAPDRPAEPDSAARLAAAASHSVVGILVATPAGVRRVSGVCVRNGQVVTSVHAIEGATGYTVISADGTRHPGTLLGRDESTRLALIQADGGSEPAKLADNGDLKVGQWILALGGTDGSGPWVATGVVAAMGGWADDGSGSPSAGMITVDASMPPEAQGGALLDRHGNVVGVLAGATADDKGGLATPIATVRDVAAQLADTGTAAHGALGVRTEDSDSPRGAKVVSVVDASAAARAGILDDDVVTSFNGAPIRNAAALVVAVRRRRPDEQVRVTVVRHGATKHLTVKLEAVTALDPQPTAAVTTG
jgi:S1-C subfamily serine protease